MREKILSWGRKYLVPVCFFIGSLSAQAHNGHDHGHDSGHEETKMDEPPGHPPSAAQIQLVNESYKRDVKPIFQNSCFDCHSQNPRLPWYYSLPGVHTLLENDMSEAKEHLDFTGDFPFQGHGSPSEDLKAIAETIKDGSMPPFRYRILHSESALTAEQRDTIFKWATEGLKQLNSKPNSEPF